MVRVVAWNFVVVKVSSLVEICVLSSKWHNYTIVVTQEIAK